MKQYRLLKMLKVIVVVLFAALIFGLVVMHLWNWLMPAIFGLRTLTFTQALGLLLLSKLFFGGFHRHGGGRRQWKRGMEDRWSNMTPEQREQFRSGMRGRARWGCRPAPEPASAERTSI